MIVMAAHWLPPWPFAQLSVIGRPEKSVPETPVPPPAFCTCTLTAPVVSTERATHTLSGVTFSATVSLGNTKLTVPAPLEASGVSTGIWPVQVESVLASPLSSNTPM
jgi:hypothetical protein